MRLTKHHIPNRNIHQGVGFSPGHKVLSEDLMNVVFSPKGGAHRNGDPSPKRYYNFDGVDDKITIPYSSDFDFNSGGDLPFTIVALIKPIDATHFRIFNKGDLAESENIEINFGLVNTDQLVINCYENSSSKRIGIKSTETFTSYENTWFWVCATYDGSETNGGFALSAFQLDGTEISLTTSGDSAGAYAGMQNNAVNSYVGTFNNVFAEGGIGYFAVFDKVISGTEFTKIRNFERVLTENKILQYHCEESTGVVSNDNSGNANHGRIENANIASFHSTDISLPYSSQNEDGYNQIHQFFPIEEWTQSQFPDMAGSGVDLIKFEDTEGSYILSRINSDSGSTDEDYVTKESGIYNDMDGLGAYFYVENKQAQAAIFFNVVPIAPLPSGKFEFYVQNSHVGGGAELFVEYNGLQIAVYNYLDSKYPDVGGFLVKEGGDRFTTLSVIDWYDNGASVTEQDELDALLPAPFKTIAEYNSSSDNGNTNTLLKLITHFDTSGTTDLMKYSGDSFTETEHGDSEERGWFVNSGYIFPEITFIQIEVPRISTPGILDTWTKFYTDKSFILGQSYSVYDESDPNKDVYGFELKYKGKIRQQSRIKNVNVMTPDGVDDKLVFSDLSGRSIVAYTGTAIPSINGNDVEFTAGWISYLEFDNGSIYRMLGGGYWATEPDLVNSLDGTWSNHSTPGISGKSDDVANYLMVNGCEVYDDDATHIQKIYVPFKEDGSRITPTISGYSLVKSLLPIDVLKKFDNDYACELDFKHYEALHDNLPTDYEVGDSIVGEMLLDDNETESVKKIVVADAEINTNVRLKNYTRTA